MKDPRYLLAQIARFVTGRFVFKKRLPHGFGKGQIRVTSRSDIRLLLPGFRGVGADLFTVSNKYIRAGDCVWDLGSNLGIFAFSAAAKAGPSGMVFSLEADPKYAEIQNQTIAELPSEYASTRVLCAAVADSIGILELAIPKNGHSRNHLAKVTGNSATNVEFMKQVPTITCDFLADHWAKPNFVKIDIEGAELLALRSAKRLLNEFRPMIYIEVNQENQKEVTALLQSANYRLFCLDEHGNEQPVRECAFNTIAKPF